MKKTPLYIIALILLSITCIAINIPITVTLTPTTAIIQTTNITKTYTITNTTSTYTINVQYNTPNCTEYKKIEEQYKIIQNKTAQLFLQYNNTQSQIKNTPSCNYTAIVQYFDKSNTERSMDLKEWLTNTMMPTTNEKEALKTELDQCKRERDERTMNITTHNTELQLKEQNITTCSQTNTTLTISIVVLFLLLLAMIYTWRQNKMEM